MHKRKERRRRLQREISLQIPSYLIGNGQSIERCSEMLSGAPISGPRVAVPFRISLPQPQNDTIGHFVSSP